MSELEPNQLKVTVRPKPGITFMAKCGASSASCTSCAATAARRAAAKTAWKMFRAGSATRLVNEGEIVVRQVGVSIYWIATLPADAVAKHGSEVAA